MQRNLTGILGTVACHLFVLVLFLAVKLGNIKIDKTKELIEIEFKQEDLKPEEEKIERKPLEDFADLSKQAMSNAASNLAGDKLNEKISTDNYEKQVMQELGIPDLNPKFEQTEKNNYEAIQPPPPKKDVVKKDANYGLTRISYLITPKRNSTYIPRPIYRCQGGGTIVIGIAIDQLGTVLEAQIKTATTTEECIKELAMESARNAVFETDYNAPKRATGTITYVFVAQ